MVAGEDEVLPVTVSAVAAWHIPSVSRTDQAKEDTMSFRFAFRTVSVLSLPPTSYQDLPPSRSLESPPACYYEYLLSQEGRTKTGLLAAVDSCYHRAQEHVPIRVPTCNRRLCLFVFVRW